ncbi:VOC family protein [Burkholderia sp. 22PA0099]|uniref:VOC family protein n=1 Tax=unclassified Burkholderia TaxID=2613784 RepID=UPI0039C494AE
MTARPLKLDHLVIAARTLDEGTAYVADTLGTEPAGGGAHPLMRTHNRLFGLWGGAYLEVIAIDPDAPQPAGVPRPRLFALDEPAMHKRIAKAPALVHWVARVEPPRHLDVWRRQYPERIPPVVRMRRGDWSWSLTVPDDGAFPQAPDQPAHGLAPSLIQWDTPRHPSDALPHHDIALTALAATHPASDAITTHLDWLGAGKLLAVSAGQSAELIASFDTPKGARTLR